MKSTKTGNLNDMDLLHTGLYGGPGGTWTRDTWIFSPLLLPTELPAHIIWTSSTTPRSYASTAGVSFLISVFISLYFRFFYYKTQFLFCKMLDSNQRPIVYQTIAHPSELISLQSYLLCVSYTKYKTKGEIIMISWLREVGLEPTISSLWGWRLSRLSTPQWVQPEDSNLVSRLWTWCPTFRRPLQYQRGSVFPVGAPTTAHERKWTAKVAGGKAENILSQ